MLITDVQPQKKDPSRYSIYIEKKFYCGASADTVAKFNLYTGKEITEKELEEFLDSELQSRFFIRTLGYLARAPKTEYQIRTYMKELIYKKKGKWFEEISKEKQEEIFEHVISKLKEYKYLNDEAFAEVFVSSRIKNKPRGKKVLISELISKGVSKDIALDIVNKLVENESDMLKRIYTKKYGEEQFTIKEKKKIAFLLRKGFQWNLIQEYIQNDIRE